MVATKQQLKTDIEFIQSLVAKNGPDEADYDTLNAFYDKVGEMRENGELSEEEVDELRNHFGEAYLTPNTLPGFTYCKPHGYAGDYEMIDAIYTQYISPNENFKKWDFWTHTLSAIKAVCNRKTYFKQLLNVT